MTGKHPRFSDSQVVARALANSGSLAYSDPLRAVSWRRIMAARLQVVLRWAATADYELSGSRLPIVSYRSSRAIRSQHQPGKPPFTKIRTVR